MHFSAKSPFLQKKILILGEVPSYECLSSSTPLSGPAGVFFREHLLPDAGLNIDGFSYTNVLNVQPPQGNIKLLTESKTELKKQGLPILGPQLFRRHMLPEYYEEAMATKNWIIEQQFDFIIALGGTALWLLTGDNRIGLFRGTIGKTDFDVEFLATYNPAAILREFKMRPLAWADLSKAKKHLEGTLAPPLVRTFIYSPTWEEMEQAYEELSADPLTLLGVDIETAPVIGQITTISFARPDYGICIPIWDKYGSWQTWNVYETAAEEVRAWRMIERFAALPNPKVMQNGLYDMQYLLDAAPFPIYCRNTVEDTNIMHHALEPELPKDLGTLGSLYVNEPGWKQMRTSKSNEEEKAED